VLGPIEARQPASACSSSTTAAAAARCGRGRGGHCSSTGPRRAHVLCAKNSRAIEGAAAARATGICVCSGSILSAAPGSISRERWHPAFLPHRMAGVHACVCPAAPAGTTQPSAPARARGRSTSGHRPGSRGETPPPRVLARWPVMSMGATEVAAAAISLHIVCLRTVCLRTVSLRTVSLHSSGTAFHGIPLTRSMPIMPYERTTRRGTPLLRQCCSRCSSWCSGI
jgi:hypothetical protein